MLTHPTHERLITLGLTGMAKALEEQRRSPDLDALSFEERVGLLVDREAAERDTKRLTTRLKFAALRQSACVEDVDLRTPRGIAAPSSPDSSSATGSTAMRTCSSQGQPGSARVGLLAPSATKLAATIVRSSIIAFRASSRRSPSLGATAAMAACSKPSGAFNSSSLMTGACRYSIRPNGATFWRSLMIAMVAPQPSSPARSPSTIG